jgi:hypothetical protein
MTELLLDVPFVDVSARRQTGVQAMSGEQGKPFGLGQITANACGQHGLFDQSRHVFVRQACLKGADIVAAGPAKQGPKVNFGKMDSVAQSG